MTTLHQAINSATPSRLQSTLYAIIKRCPEARTVAEKALLVSAAPSQSPLQRYAMCGNCEEEFDITENDWDSCHYHSGNLEVDWEARIWADHDERCHGPVDTQENQKQHPEGFIWDCCDGEGDAEGCETGEHEAPLMQIYAANRPKRRRYATCENCKEEFDVRENDEDSCTYHPGALEVDWDNDFWADTDENVAGPIDTEVNRREYPRGFLWDCCGELGDTLGCETDQHEAEPEVEWSSKRAKVDLDGTDGSNQESILLD